ncbi:hypothetical protein Tco_1565008 [Tanacetum coccineum]
MKAGGLAEEALREVSRGNSSVTQDVKPSIVANNSPGIRKRSEVQDVSGLNKDDGVPGKRMHSFKNIIHPLLIKVFLNTLRLMIDGILPGLVKTGRVRIIAKIKLIEVLIP